MRMSKSGLTAAEFLNTAEEAEIARVLRDYGEEPRARAIARAIVAARPVERTAQLAAIVRRAAAFRPGQKSDPATRTFQAIRIHLNAELDELEQGLEAAERALKPGGRLAVVTFHSLEDRIVKRFFRERSGATPSGSRHRPAIVRRAAGFRPGQKSDPATRTFQAIRIHLNAELDELEQGLEAAERALKPGGRLAVVTFHSLEDRIVKRFLRERSGSTPAGSRHRPALVDPNQPTFERVAKPVAPSEREIAANPRARSARLRSAVRTSAPARKESLQ
jgi:16S rRNA C1402 N4-methylase RsmH